MKQNTLKKAKVEKKEKNRLGLLDTTHALDQGDER